MTGGGECYSAPAAATPLELYYEVYTYLDYPPNLSLGFSDLDGLDDLGAPMKNQEAFHRALQVHILNANPTNPKPKEASMGKMLILMFVVLIAILLLLKSSGLV